jgi:hypothetical protein
MKHLISREGPLELPPSTPLIQAIIDGYYKVSTERNRNVIAFDLNIFIGLLLLLILNRQLPLSIIDAPKFKQLLIYY